MVTGKNQFFIAELSVNLFYLSNGCEIKDIANHRYEIYLYGPYCSTQSPSMDRHFTARPVKFFDRLGAFSHGGEIGGVPE